MTVSFVYNESFESNSSNIITHQNWANKIYLGCKSSNCFINLPCALVNFFNQKQYTKSGPGSFPLKNLFIPVLLYLLRPSMVAACLRLSPLSAYTATWPFRCVGLAHSRCRSYSCYLFSIRFHDGSLLPTGLFKYRL